MGLKPLEANNSLKPIKPNQQEIIKKGPIQEPAYLPQTNEIRPSINRENLTSPSATTEGLAAFSVQWHGMNAGIKGPRVAGYANIPPFQAWLDKTLAQENQKKIQLIDKALPDSQ